MSRDIPVLITLDIHSYPETEKDIPGWIEETLGVFNKLSIKATFLFPALCAEKFTSNARNILNEGHEIGCHGLTHAIEEQYNKLPYAKQKTMLGEAKSMIEGVIGREVVSFRAPVFKINGGTIRALEESGFKADLSVNPQRLGIFSSDLTNSGWIYAPREPYHPDFNNPFKRGNSSIWEIPQSAFILPFMSNTGIAFGERFMKLFFRLLYLESSWQNNPIVYMFHVEDICQREIKFRYKFEWGHLLPSKEKGFLFRYILYNNKQMKEIANQNINLLMTMKNSKGIKFVTVKDMLEMLEHKKNV